MNAEIIQHGNGDCSVKLLPTYENEKFILDVMAVIDTMKSHIAECVARNTQVNVEYGELCKSYDELKASVAAFETLKSDYAEISAEYQKEWDRRKQCDRINAELKSELEKAERYPANRTRKPA
jgi:nicotinamidase-related amidase